VTPIAGTTRDVVRQTIQIEGVPLHVVDTAGLREGADQVEQIGIERAWGQIEKADAVVFLHDLTRVEQVDYQQGDAVIAARLPQDVPVIDVWNKSDAVNPVGWGDGRNPSDAQSAGVRLRAHHQPTESHRAVRQDRRRPRPPAQKLLDIAGWQAAPEGVFIARERHLHALRRVDAHLMEAAALLARQAQALDLLAEELRLAQNALSEITGEFSADDLLGVIFSRFCIGK
jgi:tRNA modification GTPase